jgi:hypothetical protein
MARKDWLCIVAVHSDSWLLATAFYKGARFSRDERCVGMWANTSMQQCA